MSRLLRLLVVAVVAVTAVVLLTPAIRDVVMQADDAEPTGIALSAAAVAEGTVYAVGSEVGEGVDPVIYRRADDEWKALEPPPDATLVNDIAIDGDLVALAGAAGGEGAVWTATLSELDWQREDLANEVSELRSITIGSGLVVAAGMVYGDGGPGGLVLVRRDGAWSRAALRGSDIVVAATGKTDRWFYAGGSVEAAPQVWMSADGVTWLGQDTNAASGTVLHIGADPKDRIADMVGRADGRNAWFVGESASILAQPLPEEDEGETVRAAGRDSEGLAVAVGFDVDPGDEVHAVMWRASGEGWVIDDSVRARELVDIVHVDGDALAVGTVERDGQLVPILVPLS